MDVIRSRSNYPTLLRPVEYYKFKKHFQPKLAPPRKKPANSFLQLSPAKFTEAFGITISPPTLSLGNSNSFTFCDGEWLPSHPRSKRHAARKSMAEARKSIVPEPPKPTESPTTPRCTPRCTSRCVPRCTVRCTMPRTPRCQPTSCQDRQPPRRTSCFQDQEWELAQCRKALREQYDKEKDEIEEAYRRKLEECERCHRDVEDALRAEHEAKINAQQSQVDALLAKCNELKGENNLLHIKVSKMMDMLAECAAEVNLQEAELAQVAQTLQGKKGCCDAVSSCTEDDECTHDR